MHEVSSYEAKTHLPHLLRRVKEGEHITITKHNVPIAILIPATGPRRYSIPDTIQALQQFRKGKKLTNVSLRSMIEEGRK
ncbi:MAG: type II toxin-antitoxin system Phd/YefM family antitoxin [Alphaproteobacteria bacterium]|nr:type II toxin-antitoxin system Phd/YefM family antitoxin [Alphaproteobacteria bacterium]